MYDRNLKSFGTTIILEDIINDVYAVGFTTQEDVIKTVRNVIFKEKRRLMAIRQQTKLRDITGEKICNKCHKSKPVTEFYKRFDARSGFRYLCNNCKDCEQIRRFEYNSKKRKQRQQRQQQFGGGSGKTYYFT